MKSVLVNQAMAKGMDEVFSPRHDIEVRVVEEQTESAVLRHLPGVHGLVLGVDGLGCLAETAHARGE